MKCPWCKEDKAIFKAGVCIQCFREKHGHGLEALPSVSKPLNPTNDNHADLLEHLEGKGTPEELANAIEEAEENDE